MSSARLLAALEAKDYLTTLAIIKETPDLNNEHGRAAKVLLSKKLTDLRLLNQYGQSMILLSTRLTKPEHDLLNYFENRTTFQIA